MTCVTTHHFRNVIVKCRSNTVSFRDNMTQTRNHRWQFRLHMSWNRNNWKNMIWDCFHKGCIFKATWCGFETTWWKVRTTQAIFEITCKRMEKNIHENTLCFQHDRVVWFQKICNFVSKQHVKFRYHICSLETVIGPKSTLTNMPYFGLYIYQFRNHICVFRFHAPKIEK